jgi:uncharacterized membrane protein
MLMLAFIILTIVLFLATLTQPTPQWVFWAVCLGLIGLLLPLAWLALAAALLIRGMVALYRSTHG